MFLRVGVITVALLLAWGAVTRADRYEQPPGRQPFANFPMQIGGWRGTQQPPFEKRVLEVLGVDDYLTRAYFAEGRTGVGLYIGYWESQRQGDTIHSPMNCLPGAGWEPTSYSRIALSEAAATTGQAVVVNRYIVQKGLDRQLILYWYQSHGRLVASEYWSKIYMVLDAVRLNRSDGAIVRVIAAIKGEGPEAEAKAEQDARRFAADLIPRLDGFLPN